jgi:hypothetical protein
VLQVAGYLVSSRQERPVQCVPLWQEDRQLL